MEYKLEDILENDSSEALSRWVNLNDSKPETGELPYIIKRYVSFMDDLKKVFHEAHEIIPAFEKAAEEYAHKRAENILGNNNVWNSLESACDSIGHPFTSLSALLLEIVDDEGDLYVDIVNALDGQYDLDESLYLEKPYLQPDGKVSATLVAEAYIMGLAPDYVRYETCVTKRKEYVIDVLRY